MVSAKSLANLAPPFKPGQSGNPGGRPKIPEELRFVEKLNPETLARLISKLLKIDDTGWDSFCVDPKRTRLERMLITTINKGMSEGDPRHLEWLMSRTIGKIKEIEDDGDGVLGAFAEAVKELSKEQLAAFLRERQEKKAAGND